MATTRRGTVTDTDRGWDAVMKTLHDLKSQRPRVLTGITSARGEAVHRNNKRAESVADIGRKHEFGIGVKERSFLRSTFDENRDAYQKYLVNGMRREVLAVAQSNQPIDITTSVTLKRLGLKREGDIKKKIRGHIPPPNTPSTIRSKGSSTPLVDTGQLIGALASELRRGGT